MLSIFVGVSQQLHSCRDQISGTIDNSLHISKNLVSSSRTAGRHSCNVFLSRAFQALLVCPPFNRSSACLHTRIPASSKVSRIEQIRNATLLSRGPISTFREHWGSQTRVLFRLWKSGVQILYSTVLVNFQPFIRIINFTDATHQEKQMH